MIRVGISIPDVDGGKVNDTYDKYGFVYLSSDTILAPTTKGFDVSSYPEEEGENILPKTVDEAFDYTVEFLVEASGSLETVNSKIAAFNSSLYTQASGSDVKVFRAITFYNYYKNVKIVGIPTPIAKATDYWKDSKGNQSDAARVSLTIRVTKPSLCDFNYK